MEGAAATVGGLFLFSLCQATSIKKRPATRGCAAGRTESHGPLVHSGVLHLEHFRDQAVLVTQELHHFR